MSHDPGTGKALQPLVPMQERMAASASRYPQARGEGSSKILRRILGTNHGPTIHPTFVNFSESNNEQRRELKCIK